MMDTMIQRVHFPSMADVSVSTILSSIIVILFTTYIIDRFRKNPKHVKFAKTLPGPPVLPLFGNTLDFFSKIDGSMRFLMDYEKAYGSIYRLWFGKHLAIGATNLEFLEAIFQSSKVLDKPPLMDTFNDFWDDFNVFTAKTTMWKKSRKELQIFFTKNSLSKKLPQINGLIRKYVQRMEKHVNGPLFDLGAIMDVLTFETIIEVLLNASINCPEEELAKLSKCFTKADTIAVSKMFKPWLDNRVADFIFYRNKKREFKEQTTSFFNKIMENQLVVTEPAAEDQSSFMDQLFKIKDNLNLEERYIQSEAIIMISAGNVTTASTASFCLLMLAMHPDIQDKLYAEIKEKFGDTDRELDINELNELPFLDQVLKETERRFLLVPTIFRYVNEEITIGPHTIPEGTSVLVAAKAIHMSEKYYKNPEEFDPDHFNPVAVSERPKFAFFPFSTGARNCLGKALAEIQLKLIVINALRQFKFSTTEKMEDIKVAFGFTAYLETYMVKVEHRNQSNK